MGVVFHMVAHPEAEGAHMEALQEEAHTVEEVPRLANPDSLEAMEDLAVGVFLVATAPLVENNHQVGGEDSVEL